MKPLFFPLFIWCKVSCTVMMPFSMLQSLMKPIWYSPIISFNIGLKRLVSTLKIILTVLSRSRSVEVPTISTPFFLNQHNIWIIQSTQSSYSIIHLCYYVHVILFDQVPISFEKDDRRLSTHDALYIGNLCITPLISFSNIFTF